MAGIEMWFQADVAKILTAVELAQTSIMAYVPSTLEANAYRAGCADTMAAVKAGFGLPPSNTTSSRPSELAGLWDSAESEPVAVNPAAADANR